MRMFEPILRPHRAHFYTNGALLLGHVPEMARQSRPGNTEQFCRTTLVLICLLVNEPDMTFHSLAKRRSIPGARSLLLLADEETNLPSSDAFRSGSSLEEKRHARAELPNHCKTASWYARCGSIREGFRAPMVKQLLHRFRMNCRMFLPSFNPAAFNSAAINAGSSCSRSRSGGMSKVRPFRR